jgi:hypothetical protein
MRYGVGKLGESNPFFSSILLHQHAYSLPIYYLLSFLYSSRKYFKPPHGAPIASKIISKGQESKNIWINILLLA